MDDASFAQFEGMLYEGARTNGKSHGLRSDELAGSKFEKNGHDAVDVRWRPKSTALAECLNAPSNRAVFKSPGDYERASRDNSLSQDRGESFATASGRSSGAVLSVLI